ncbi:acetyl-CoA carboxylase [Johnsonella ignava ATCC 51276]|jgi:acetyl-CoA carboxylase, biotin carboxyl carrier protein|uniref:Biotin carboxyl carrier protein of acetyl-CoA carboxylase n=1 Tax=Johnsonella ignava ATCC 51276 TaxID=679200 RepID=G5GKY7_9FIRM|nr:acetyl-CoA carboxylase biotin carboxyl carrier protein [Johnsonella ignava]EHI54590.1 acetyl-CoA carboxylase [Johnsonella ignava ATCC 51276]
MNIEDMLTLIEAVKKHGIESFSYKNETEKIVIKKKPKQTVLASELEVLKDVQAYDNEEKEDIVSDIGSDKVVASPLVGTFYAAPSPESEPFVSVGVQVKKGQVLGIIEAMKLMNEIECEYDGVIEAVLVEDGSVVEYGQPLFRIR